MGAIAIEREVIPEFDSSAAVLVLSLSDYPFQHGVLGTIRSLGRLGIPVFVVQPNIFTPADASRYLAGRYICKQHDITNDSFQKYMATLGETLNRPTILIPSDDMSAILIAENADALSSWFIFARQPPSLPRMLASKRCLHQLCQRFGFDCPQTFFPQTREELLEIAAHQHFPVVVKVAEPWLMPKGFKSVTIAQRPDDLIAYYDNFARQSPATTLMIQEMVSAKGSEDWIVHGYCDSKSEPLVLFTGVKLRSYPAFAGHTTLGRSVRNDALRQQATQLFSAIGYCGIMDLDWRLDGRDGRYKLLDFNPRLGAQFRLFGTDLGIDVVRALHLDLTGRHSSIGAPVEGRTFMLDAHDVLASWGYWRNGSLTLKDWFRSLRGPHERAWYAADDPLPFLLMALRMSVRAISRNS